MQTCVAEIASGLFARIADGIRSVAWIAAVLAVIIAFGAPTSGCGSAASDFGTDGGTDAGLTFHVDISLTTGLIAFPNKYSGWSVGGGSATNFVGYPSAQGWTIGGGSATNFTALPPGWSAGGGSSTNFIAVPPGWVVGGGSATNFVTYPGPSVTTIQVKFDDPGWLGLLKAAQDSGSYSEQTLADIVMYAFLNLRARAPHRMEAPAGEW